MQEMRKKSTIALIAHRLSKHAPHLCQIISQRGKICPLWRPLTQSLAMLMTLMVQIRELLMQEMWKKSTIALNAHILSKLAPNLCKIICWEDEICPVWRPLSLQSSTLMTKMVQIRKALMQEMWTKSTFAFITHRLSKLAPNLCQIISQKGEICPLWRPLTQSLAMLMTWMVQIRELLMQEMWKNQQSYW